MGRKLPGRLPELLRCLRPLAMLRGLHQKLLRCFLLHPPVLPNRLLPVLPDRLRPPRCRLCRLLVLPGRLPGQFHFLPEFRGRLPHFLHRVIQ